MTTTEQTGAELPLEQCDRVVIRFAGDSGDGMQITGNQFTHTSAVFGNDLATLPDFPAEIRAPAGTRAGVSGFQLQFSSRDIHTPGDEPDVLVAMNPAALIVNYKDLRSGGTIIANTGAFTAAELRKASLDTNPLEDGTLAGYRVIQVDINKRVQETLADSPLKSKDIQRCKNFYTLGLMYWLYSRPVETTLNWLDEKFAKRPEVADANKKALQAGYNAGDIQELFQSRYAVPPCGALPAGTYRNIMGNQAVALGLAAGAELAGLKLFLGSYPITPATTILEELAALKNFGVKTFQAEDEIAGICTALGASYAGYLGATTTSGPGLALKTEAMGLAVITELPLVIVNVQRGGPSTGLPTKVEQADLLQSVCGRNSEAPLPVLACATAADSFDCAVEACRIAIEYMTPVILLSDNFIANGSQPWKLPRVDDLPKFPVTFRKDPVDFLPYSRNEKGARPWVIPGTKDLVHRIGGLEKDETGNISITPENHEIMTRIRQDKIIGIRDSIPTPAVDGPESGDLLVLGWGSTKGPINGAVERVQEAGQSVSQMHLRHIWPFPKGLDEIFGRFKAVMIPEMNMGQLTRLLRSEYPQHNFISYPKVQGQPFRATEIATKIKELLEN
ncbi:MAG: 2-oxoacid:acceptor oxidoreductase subunit alpha [Planctomycetota bacterium]|jgi:2-oxoglutarate ferredoxin oxidoreductase subunit alpha|nr:2-oxoglutarate ferredoxin oxidoreductase subunit alpha [Planctomycetota bacterium]MDP6837395.1 2-oxoacid:acceptor oxidoreductase subunit alpha [Planctomycetota bacterium]MDP6955248.1 2-oxoacid:acceptor oxidoreductase subunit alpha [Planctomycetota bacterium]